MPGAAGATIPTPASHVRQWNIIHACDAAAPVLALAHAQADIGMRPALLTPFGWFTEAASPAIASPASLINAWREVRRWRALFGEQRVGGFGEILHAHCFSAAMAGVRAGYPVVYDFYEPVGTASAAGPWLTRSLRVAEGFVLTRAAAVVVHTQCMWDIALGQGVRAEDLFLVPEPAGVYHVEHDPVWLEQITGACPEVTLFASADSEIQMVMRAFALLDEEVEGVHLLVEHADAAMVESLASELGVKAHVIGASDRRRAVASASMVIAGASAPGPNPLAIDALAHGRALLAADSPANREVSAHGRGCLWYSPKNERDLAFRAAFLARNPDFRAALGANGQAHIEATRGAINVARRYDEVYRHAAEHLPGGPDLFHRVPALALCS